MKFLIMQFSLSFHYLRFLTPKYSHQLFAVHPQSLHTLLSQYVYMKQKPDSKYLPNQSTDQLVCGRDRVNTCQ